MKMENEQTQMLTVLGIIIAGMNKDWKKILHAQIDFYPSGNMIS